MSYTLDPASVRAPEFSGPLTEFLAEAIPQEARLVHRTYKLVPAEDIEQEMWVKALARRASFEGLAESADYGKARQRLKEAGYKLIREDDRYRRAIKAAALGYRPSDEQFYTLPVLKVLLPFYLDNGISERPPQGRDLKPEISGGGGSDYFAMILDLDIAWHKIKHYHRSILARYYEFPQGSGGFTHIEISGRLGIEPDALRMRRNRALGALQRELGGKNPYGRPALDYKEVA